MNGPLQGPSLAEVLKTAVSDHPPGLSAHQWKIINTLIVCRTPVLGGHRYHCQRCGHDHYLPRSCGNRHCPHCQSAQAMAWRQGQEELLLPVPYFHVVFTLPHPLNGLIAQNQRALYNLLFASASKTLLAFSKNNLGITPGITAVLHTWSQKLTAHYHLHCLITGGGLICDGSGEWKQCSPKFLFHVRAMGRVFCGKYVAGLRRLFRKGKLSFHGSLAELKDPRAFDQLLTRACGKPWNVYAKRPFAGPQQVLHYFSCYTHRVALSPRRLLSLDTTQKLVRFTWKTRDQPPQHRTAQISVPEFLSRFALHILPKGLVKIRHYGLLANRDRTSRMERLQKLLGLTQSDAEPQPIHSRNETPPDPSSRLPVCPHCGERALVRVGRFAPIRGSPQ